MEAIANSVGGCACGAARYQITGEPLSVHACHCTDCQTLSGSAFGLSMILKQTDMALTAGEVAINKFATDHNQMHRHHCIECGAALWFSSPEYAGIVALKPGTLDNTFWLRPVAHLWVRSAQPWLDLGGDIPIYQEQPPLSELLELAGRAQPG